MPVPNIVCIEQNPELAVPRQLIGLRVTDAEPIGEALVCLGVPEAEVEQWDIYTRAAAETPTKNEHYAQLEPRLFSATMKFEARRLGKVIDEEGNYTAAYVHAFSTTVGPTALFNLAREVSRDQNDRPSYARTITAAIPSATTGIASYVLLKQGFEFPPIPAMVGGSILGATTLALNFPRQSQFRLARERMMRAQRLDPHLEQRLGRVILPIFQQFPEE